MIGKTIKRYELLDEVGRGGMSVVYRGLDTSLDREVAIKVLHPHLASRPESSQRFQREAKAVAKLRHPHIVEIFDFSGDEDSDYDSKFIVTEFIDGQTLREFVEETAVRFPEVGIAISIQLCQALEHAHELKIIHRDIKPENVMVSRVGDIKLMDFGIARVLDSDRMTASGSLLGSPAHMPPEIIDGKPSDFRGDIFSLGTVLYYLTTNTLPFIGTSPTAVLRNIIESRYAPPQRANPKIGRGLATIIEKCLESDADNRYADVSSLKEALESELESMQVDDPAALSTAYITDPDGFSESFQPKVLKRLLERATQAVHARNMAEASDLLNQVLAYEPDNAEANDLLNRLRSGRRLRVFGMVALACVLLLGVAYLALQLARTNQDAPAPPTAEAEEEPAALDPTALRELGARASRLPKDKALAIKAGGRSVARELTPNLAVIADALALLGARGASLGMSGTAGTKLSALIARTDTVRSRPIRTVESSGTNDAELTSATDGGLAAVTAPGRATLARATFPVYPCEAYADINTKRYSAVSCEIVVELPPGEYDVVLSCPVRCTPVKQRLILPPASGPDVENWNQKRVALGWADSRFRVKPNDENSYWYAVRDGESTGKILPVPAGRYVDVTGYRGVGYPKHVVVYEVSNDAQVNEVNPQALKRAGARVQEKALEPGETATFIFDT